MKLFYKPSILIWLDKMFKHAKEKQWYETYHCFDIHGVISKPDYRKSGSEFKIDYYPYAKETLQFLTKNRPDMVLFIFTSSYQEEIDCYQKQFKKDGIYFKYVNENPEVSESKGSFGFYDKKPYFNSYFEDKSGFDPITDWKPIYKYFKKSKYKPDSSWSFKTKEKYHQEKITDEDIVKYFIVKFGKDFKLIKVLSSNEFITFYNYHDLDKKYVINILKDYLHKNELAKI